MKDEMKDAATRFESLPPALKVQRLRDLLALSVGAFDECAQGRRPCRCGVAAENLRAVLPLIR